jgi:hypothetical protein
VTQPLEHARGGWRAWAAALGAVALLGAGCASDEAASRAPPAVASGAERETLIEGTPCPQPADASRKVFRAPHVFCFHYPSEWALTVERQTVRLSGDGGSILVALMTDAWQAAPLYRQADDLAKRVAASGREHAVLQMGEEIRTQVLSRLTPEERAALTAEQRAILDAKVREEIEKMADAGDLKIWWERLEGRSLAVLGGSHESERRVVEMFGERRYVIELVQVPLKRGFAMTFSPQAIEGSWDAAAPGFDVIFETFRVTDDYTPPDA